LAQLQLWRQPLAAHLLDLQLNSCLERSLVPTRAAKKRLPRLLKDGHLNSGLSLKSLITNQDINVFGLEIKDRDSARLMASSTKNLWPQIGPSIGYNIGFFGILFAMLSNGQNGIEFPPGIKETLICLLGVMAGELKNINSFWGGSVTAAEKSDQAFAHVVESLKK
jgi:hypothetical protein